MDTGDTVKIIYGPGKGFEGVIERNRMNGFYDVRLRNGAVMSMVDRSELKLVKRGQGGPIYAYVC